MQYQLTCNVLLSIILMQHELSARKQTHRNDTQTTYWLSDPWKAMHKFIFLPCSIVIKKLNI